MSSSGGPAHAGDRRDRDQAQQSTGDNNNNNNNNNNSSSGSNPGTPRETATYAPKVRSDLRADQHPVIVIALTGGPCAGKSTSLVAISTEVQRRTNFKVYCVPEAATLLVTGGLEWKDMDFDRTVEYQLALLRTQIALEDTFKQVARACGQPAVIICDRGTMDGKSYCTTEQWDEICRRGGFHTSQLRDNRYDAVLHLVTAAIGAENFYNLDNNPARFEDVDGAKEADLRLRRSYIGHPRIKLIDNKPGERFQSKVNNAVDFVFQCIGHAPPRHDKRRFLLRWSPTRTVPLAHEVVQVTATVLAQSTADSYSVVMHRRNRGISTRIYLLTGHETSAPQKRSQQQMNLTEKEYNLLTEQQHPDHVPLEKSNIVFETNGAFYDLAVHKSPPWIAGYATLYVDGLPEGEGVKAMPEFLHDAVETTQHEKFSSFHQSEKSRAKETAALLDDVIKSRGCK